MVREGGIRRRDKARMAKASVTIKRLWVNTISKNHQNKVSRSEVKEQNDKTPSLSVVGITIYTYSCML